MRGPNIIYQLKNTSSRLLALSVVDYQNYQQQITRITSGRLLALSAIDYQNYQQQITRTICHLTKLISYNRVKVHRYSLRHSGYLAATCRCVYTLLLHMQYYIHPQTKHTSIVLLHKGYCNMIRTLYFFHLQNTHILTLTSHTHTLRHTVCVAFL